MRARPRLGGRARNRLGWPPDLNLADVDCPFFFYRTLAIKFGLYACVARVPSPTSLYQLERYYLYTRTYDLFTCITHIADKEEGGEGVEVILHSLAIVVVRKLR